MPNPPSKSTTKLSSSSDLDVVSASFSAPVPASGSASVSTSGSGSSSRQVVASGSSSTRGAVARPRIYVAGHRGMVGSAIVRQLRGMGVDDAQIITRTHAELDLTDQVAARRFFEAEKPDQVYLAAAKVGGIHANNTYPADFILDLVKKVDKFSL